MINGWVQLSGPYNSDDIIEFYSDKTNVKVHDDTLTLVSDHTTRGGLENLCCDYHLWESPSCLCAMTEAVSCFGGTCCRSPANRVLSPGLQAYAISMPTPAV
jgi:hypothetical protein